MFDEIHGKSRHHRSHHHRNHKHMVFSKIPIRGLLHILILKILKESSIHGGEIYRQLKERYDVDAPKPIIYGVLRRMEKHGLLLSKWNIKEEGPATRVYIITEEGIDYLEDALEKLKKIREIIDKIVT